MSNRLTIEAIKYFVEVESKSGCKLLSTEYISSKSKLTFLCSCKKNKFNTTYNNFKTNKRQCNKCGKNNMKKILSLDINDIIKFTKENSRCECLETEYINNYTKMKFKCHCGKEYERSYASYIKGNKICRECEFKSSGQKKALTIKDVKHFIEFESKSGCKLLSTEYINNNTKLDIQCDCKRIFRTSYNNFVNNNQRQCQECGNIKKGLSHRNNYQEVKHYIEVESKSGCKLLSTEYERSIAKLEIQCSCKRIFRTSYNKFQNGQTRCKICSKKESNGEYVIRKWLEENNIYFEQEKKFNDCRNPISKRELPFDFYLKKYDIIIEFDGKQHFEPSNFHNKNSTIEEMNKNLRIIQNHDNIKNIYCKDNNIKLLRIPYFKFSKIGNVLNNLKTTLIK